MPLGVAGAPRLSARLCLAVMRLYGYLPRLAPFGFALAFIAMADYDPESGLTYERPSSMVERQPNDNEK